MVDLINQQEWMIHWINMNEWFDKWTVKKDSLQVQ